MPKTGVQYGVWTRGATRSQDGNDSIEYEADMKFDKVGDGIDHRVDGVNADRGHDVDDRDDISKVCANEVRRPLFGIIAEGDQFQRMMLGLREGGMFWGAIRSDCKSNRL